MLVVVLTAPYPQGDEMEVPRTPKYDRDDVVWCKVCRKRVTRKGVAKHEATTGHIAKRVNGNG